MTTYAMVIDGVVRSHFTTDKKPSDFPDIEKYLVECAPDIVDGSTFDGKDFSVPVAEVAVDEVAVDAVKADIEADPVLTQLQADVAAIKEKLGMI